MWSDVLERRDTRMVRRGRNSEMLREVARDVSHMAVRGVATYDLSTQICRRMNMSSEYSTAGAIALTALQLLPDVVDLCERYEKKFRPIPQCEFFEGVPGEGYIVLCDEEVFRLSPYTFRYSDSDGQYTITGIACVPVSAEIQSPAAKVVGGGINKSYANISLIPEEEGQFGCRIIITGKKQPPHQQRCDALALRNSKEIPQCQFIEGCPETGTVVHKQRVVRCSHEPFTIKYSHPTNIITGIACVPVDTETQSPEAEVIEGGVNYNHVAIRLTPVDSGKWACDVAICVKTSTANVDEKANSASDSAAPTNSTRAAEAPAVSTHASAFLADFDCASAASAFSIRASTAAADSTHASVAPANSIRPPAAPAVSTRANAAATVSTRSSAAPADSTRAAAVPADSTRAAAAPADSTRAAAPAADSTHDSGAPADSTSASEAPTVSTLAAAALADSTHASVDLTGSTHAASTPTGSAHASADSTGAAASPAPSVPASGAVANPATTKKKKKKKKKNKK